MKIIKLANKVRVVKKWFEKRGNTFVRVVILGFALSFILTACKSDTKNDPEWYLIREDVDIFVKELGTGKDTVIVVHGGFGANHEYMIDAIKGLEKKFHFVFYDQRGSVLSPTKIENLTFQKNVDDLYALVKDLKLTEVKFFCHSMGTLVGMEFTKQHPGLVSNLVLTGAIFPKCDSVQTVFSERMEKQVAFLSERQEVIDLLKPFRDKGADKQFPSLSEIEKTSLSHKEMTDYWRLIWATANIYNVKKYNLLKGGRAYYKGTAGVMVQTVNWNYDYRSVMNNTNTTIINGAYDFLDFNGDTQKTLLNGFPNIRLLIIPNAGHNSWIDNPKLFKKYLLTALK